MISHNLETSQRFSERKPKFAATQDAEEKNEDRNLILELAANPNFRISF